MILSSFHMFVSVSWVHFSCSIMCNSLQLCGLQHARPPCPSPTPGIYSSSCPLSRWCHPTISSSVNPVSSCPQSLPASGSSPMSQLFTFSFSISPSNEYSGLISLRIDWLHLLAVQRTLKNLLHHYNLKASILLCSALLIVQFSHLRMTSGKTENRSSSKSLHPGFIEETLAVSAHPTSLQCFLRKGLQGPTWEWRKEFLHLSFSISFPDTAFEKSHLPTERQVCFKSFESSVCSWLLLVFWVRGADILKKIITETVSQWMKGRQHKGHHGQRHHPHLTCVSSWRLKGCPVSAHGKGISDILKLFLFPEISIWELGVSREAL